MLTIKSAGALARYGKCNLSVLFTGMRKRPKTALNSRLFLDRYILGVSVEYRTGGSVTWSLLSKVLISLIVCLSTIYSG